MVDLQDMRAVYARQMLAQANAQSDSHLECAFATTARERFLGDAPWLILPPNSRYIPLARNDPTLIYQDVLVALSPDRCLNNGSPALHARLLHAMQVREGEIVAHLGAGTGYYSAILAALVGERGRVLAVETDDKLAVEAERNLRSYANVEVVHADGADQPTTNVDCIYVNFAVPRPDNNWLERLNDGGRLMLPLGVPSRYAFADGGRHAVQGIALLVKRSGETFGATTLGEVSFIYAEGRLDASHDDLAGLQLSLQRKDADRIKSLQRSVGDTAEAWFQGDDWALCF